MVFTVVVLALAFLLGHISGAWRERNQLHTGLGEHQSQIQSLDEKYRAEIDTLKAQRDVADASNRALQTTLKELEEQALDAQSAERLYQRIEGEDVSTGLAIDTVSKVTDADGSVTELHITVVQARGRDRVSGRIGVALLGEKNDANWREIVVDASSDSAPRFDLRFFQTLVVPVEPDDILIDIVEIDVVPRGKRHKPFKFEQLWSGVLQE